MTLGTPKWGVVHPGNPLVAKHFDKLFDEADDQRALDNIARRPWSFSFCRCLELETRARANVPQIAAQQWWMAGRNYRHPAGRVFKSHSEHYVDVTPDNMPQLSHHSAVTPTPDRVYLIGGKTNGGKINHNIFILSAAVAHSSQPLGRYRYHGKVKGVTAHAGGKRKL